MLNVKTIKAMNYTDYLCITLLNMYMCVLVDCFESELT